MFLYRVWSAVGGAVRIHLSPGSVQNVAESVHGSRVVGAPGECVRQFDSPPGIVKVASEISGFSSILFTVSTWVMPGIVSAE